MSKLIINENKHHQATVFAQTVQRPFGLRKPERYRTIATHENRTSNIKR